MERAGEVDGGRPPGRVLVVDDEAETRLAYRALLEHGGWTVEEAASGDEALRLAGLQPPRLVLLDISIPGVDGWETTRRLKTDARTSSVPVLAVTAHALDDDRRRAREVGCDGYLVKPVPPTELLATIERLAGGRPPSPK
jgi:two-component system, cell cycle response regulator DivK